MSTTAPERPLLDCTMPRHDRSLYLRQAHPARRRFGPGRPWTHMRTMIKATQTWSYSE